MCSVLAPPGHGKSAYLKALSRRLPRSTVTGTVSFSGVSDRDAGASGVHLGSLVQYVSQLDEHSPHLTVLETLSFVYDNATVDPAAYGWAGGNHAGGIGDMMKLLHLEGCKNTIIGNDLLR